MSFKLKCLRGNTCFLNYTHFNCADVTPNPTTIKYNKVIFKICILNPVNQVK